MDPSLVGTRSGPPPPGGSAAGAGGRLARSPRGGRLALAALGLVVVGAVVAAATRGGGGDGSTGGADLDRERSSERSTEESSEVRERTDGERTDGERTDGDRAGAAAEDDEESGARRAFAQASRRLQLAGSFAYEGTVHAPAASDARPAQAPSPHVTVEGEVLWPLRTRDVAVDATGRAAETVTVGPTIWQRRALMPGLLATEAYAFAGDVTTWTGAVVPYGAGAARIPGWLTATTDRAFRSERSGRQTFVAALPADRLGTVDPNRRPQEAEVTLTVDADGDPLHVEIEVPGAAATGSDWRLSLDITAIGDPIAIDIPDGELPSVTDGPSPAEVRAAGIAPVELARLPQGWMLTTIMLVRNDQRPECPRLELDYGAADAPAGAFDWLSLDVLPLRCGRAGEVGSFDEPMTAGPFVGGPARFPQGMGGVLSDGRTTVEYVSSLPTDEALRLLATLEPYDPATRPTAFGAAP
jgi:hypothetical protein